MEGSMTDNVLIVSQKRGSSFNNTSTTLTGKDGNKKKNLFIRMQSRQYCTKRREIYK